MADEPTPRKRGRPRATEPGSPLTVWLPQRTHDRLCTVARKTDQSVSSIARRLLTRAVTAERGK